MRTVSQQITDALNNTTARITARLRVFKSRIWVEEKDFLGSYPDWAPATSEITKPVSLGFSAETGKVVGVAINSGLLVMQNIGKAWQEVTSGGSYVTASSDCRPGIAIGTDENYSGSVFWHDGTEWKFAQYDSYALEDEDPAALGTKFTFTDTIPNGACHPLLDTFDEWSQAFFYIDEGGVRCAYKDNNGDEFLSPGRFLDPTGPIDISTLQYTAAVLFNGKVYFYYSSHQGDVKYMIYTPDANGGNWSVIETAIPQDLSDFKVGNAFVANNRVWLVGSFNRREEFDAPGIWTFLTYSYNGKIFSLDRRVMLSNLSYRLMAVLDDTENLVLSSYGLYTSQPAHYQLIGENTNTTIGKIVSASGGLTSIGITLKSGEEEYVDDELFHSGNYCYFDIGIYTSAGIEYVPYFECVIDTVEKSYEDGKRTFTLSIVPSGLWNINKLSHPFYMEKQGMQSKFDPVTDLSNLDNVNESAGLPWSLMVDFWNTANNDSGGNFPPKTHDANTESDYWSEDLKDLMEEYPVFGSDETYDMLLYGWSRAGVPDTNPNTADSTPTSTTNDRFYGLLLVEDSVGAQREIVTEITQLLSTYANPPQTWFVEGARSGSYPVKYTIPNPGVGYKIIKVGIRVAADDTTPGNTTYYAERVEMPEIICLYSQAETVGFQSEDIQSSWELIDTKTLTITTNNGNINQGTGEIDDSLDITIPSSSYQHAIAIVAKGEVVFTRNNIRYRQNAHFYITGVGADPDPAWNPLVSSDGLVQNAAIQICIPDGSINGSIYAPYSPDDDPLPQFHSTIVADALPATEEANDNHVYQLHVDYSDSGIIDSTVSASACPYFLNTLSTELTNLRFNLAGSGTISSVDAELNTITFYIFASPEPWPTSFDYVLPGTALTSGAEMYLVEAAPTSQNLGLYRSYISTKTFSQYGQGQLNTLHQINISHTQSTDGYGGYWLPSHSIGPNDMTPPYPQVEVKFSVYVSSPPEASLRSVTITTGHGLGNSKTIDATNGVVAGEVIYYYYPTWLAGNDWWPTHFSIEWNYDEVPNPPVSINCSSSIQVKLVTENWPSTDIPLPAAPTFNLIIPEEETISSGIGQRVISKNKGIPSVMFAMKPYSGFCFDQRGRFSLRGDYSYAGLVGMGVNKSNYLLAYITKTKTGLARVNNGMFTIVHQIDEVHTEDTLYDLRFTHYDGKFIIGTKLSTSPTWQNDFTYYWLEIDGPLAIQDDIFHLGAFSWINPPKFRIATYKGGQRYLAILPADIDPQTGTSRFSEFPTTGQITIDGYKYSYDGKVNNVSTIAGPFGLRNVKKWGSTYIHDPDGSPTYQNSSSIEITQFNWWDGESHKTDYQNAIVSVDDGVNWLNDETQWKVWILTNSKKVYLRNRARHYSDTIATGYTGSISNKVYLTNGLDNLFPLTSGNMTHQEGSFAFLDSDDSVTIHGFMATSGTMLYNVQRLLDEFTRVSGAQPDFPGDTYHTTLDSDSQTFNVP